MNLDPKFLGRRAKRTILVMLDMLVLLASWSVYFFQDFNFDKTSFNLSSNSVSNSIYATLFSVLVMFLLRVYHLILRHNQQGIFFSVGLSGLFSSCVIFTLLKSQEKQIDEANFFLIQIVAVALLISYRFVIVRLVANYDLQGQKALIYGAGGSGRGIAAWFSSHSDWNVAGFIDDDKDKIGSFIQGVPVYSSSRVLDLVSKYKIDVIVLAINNMSAERRNGIISHLKKFRIKLIVAPSLEAMVLNTSSELNQVKYQIKDLLGRNEVVENKKLLVDAIFGKTILVTGAGGSIASTLILEILEYQPKKIILIDNSEHSLFQIDLKLQALSKKQGSSTLVEVRLADITRKNQIEDLFSSGQIDLLFHAAAYKHVDLVERNLLTGLYNNMIGCKNIVELSVKHRVKKFVCISTDKAVHPSNAMGASKRFCELLCLSFNAPDQLTKFSVVRFGNVAGSSGSVIPIFISQIEAGGPVTVTHPDATRYMMLITEAVKLVIKATILKTEGSGITVLDMGKPRKILNIAKELIDIHGKQFTYDEEEAANSNGETIQIIFSGLKEGEKLHEKLSYSPKMKKTDIEKILWEPQFQASPKLMLSMVNRLEKACLHGDAAAAKKLVMTELKNLEKRIDQKLKRKNGQSPASLERHSP